MKVKELCELIEEGYFVEVFHNGEWLKGQFSNDFLDCELEVKCVYVGNCDDIVIET